MGKTLRRSLLAIAVAIVWSLVGLALAQAQNEASALYKNKCSACHADNGSGKTTAGAKMNIPDLRSKEVQAQSDDKLFSTIAQGEGHKESPHAFKYKGMTDDQIRLVIAHMRQLAKPRASGGSGHASH